MSCYVLQNILSIPLFSQYLGKQIYQMDYEIEEVRKIDIEENHKNLLIDFVILMKNVKLFSQDKQEDICKSEIDTLYEEDLYEISCHELLKQKIRESNQKNIESVTQSIL